MLQFSIILNCNYKFKCKTERSKNMIYSKEVERMCPVAKGVDHGPAPIPEEG